MWQLEPCLLLPDEGSDFCPCCYSQKGKRGWKNERKQMLAKLASLGNTPTAHGPGLTISRKGRKK